MIIGITGGTGCGKTTALQLIADLGGLVIDCDRVYHDLLKTDRAMLSELERRFPGTVENGQLNRKKLASIVFADEKALLDLNGITHKAVKKEVLRLLENGLKLISNPVQVLCLLHLYSVCSYLSMTTLTV